MWVTLSVTEFVVCRASAPVQARFSQTRIYSFRSGCASDRLNVARYAVAFRCFVVFDVRAEGVSTSRVMFVYIFGVYSVLIH